MTKERALAQMRALTATQALATLVGWQSDPATRLLLRSPFSEWFYAATPDLLLVPSIEPSRGDLRTVDQDRDRERAFAAAVNDAAPKTDRAAF